MVALKPFTDTPHFRSWKQFAAHNKSSTTKQEFNFSFCEIMHDSISKFLLLTFPSKKPFIDVSFTSWVSFGHSYPNLHWLHSPHVGPKKVQTKLIIITAILSVYHFLLYHILSASIHVDHKTKLHSSTCTWPKIRQSGSDYLTRIYSVASKDVFEY